MGDNAPKPTVTPTRVSSALPNFLLSATQKTIGRIFKTPESKGQSYDVILLDDYLEIDLLTEKKKVSNWKYIPDSLVLDHERSPSYQSPEGAICAVKGTDYVTPAVNFLVQRDSTPNKIINRLLINTKAFNALSKEEAVALAQILVQSVGECKELVVVGEDDNTKAVTHIINHLKISGVVYADYVILDRDNLNYLQFRNVPVTLFCLENVFPADIMFWATNRTTINLERFSATQINKLLICWASGDNISIETLILTAKHTPEFTPYTHETVFHGFKFKTLGNTSTAEYEEKLKKLDARFGVEIWRSDGAVASVRYFSLADRTEFNMHVDYPDNHSIASLKKELVAAERKMAKEYQKSLALCREAKIKKSSLQPWHHGMDMQKVSKEDRIKMRADYEIHVGCEKRAAQRHFTLPGREQAKVKSQLAKHKDKCARFGYFILDETASVE